MSPSPKGRVLHNRTFQTAGPPQKVTGSCAWCGQELLVPRAPETHCPRCDSLDIDWLEPSPGDKHQHVANTHAPGSIAYSVLGGFVRGGS